MTVYVKKKKSLKPRPVLITGNQDDFPLTVYS